MSTLFNGDCIAEPGTVANKVSSLPQWLPEHFCLPVNEFSMQVSDLSVAKPRFDNGLLKVTLPKRPELVGEQRKIEIKKN